MILGLAMGLYFSYQNIIVFYIAFFVLICYLFDDISRDLLISCGLSDLSSRKQAKNKFSIVKDSSFKRFVYYTASNTAFYHLIILTSTVDLINSKYFPQILDISFSHFYIFYFSFFMILKMLFRLPLIISLKDK